MTEDIGKACYAILRQHESFDFGEWEGLTPGQRAYVGGAADAVLAAANIQRAKSKSEYKRLLMQGADVLLLPEEDA